MRLVALAAAALTFAYAPVGAQTITIPLAAGETMLRVEAEGEYKVRPDMMSVTAGVVTTARTAREALNANNALANRLIAAITAQGIAASDMRTTELSVRPRFAEDKSGDEDARRITGYIASDKLELRLRELSRAPDLIDALFQGGANTVDGPHFSLAEPNAVLHRAREAAVRAARDEANIYAAALGLRVARVLRVSEQNESDWSDRDGAIMVTGSRIARTPVQPGEMTVRRKIWVDFALVPAR